MAFTPINFLNAPMVNKDYSGLSDLFSNYLQAKNAATQSQVASLNAQAEPYRIQNELQRAPLERALIESQAAKARNEALYGGGLTGSAQKAFGLERLKQVHGPDSEVYQNAKRAFEAELNAQETLDLYRKVLTTTKHKSTASPLGKLNLEREEVKSGFVPGSNFSIPLNEEEKQAEIDRLDLAILKQTTDPKIREKVLYASNIDKTLDSFDPTWITNFSGPFGSVNLKKEQAASLSGNPSEEYKRYERAIAATKVLAGQIRQFYGESIQPSVREHIEELANPSHWLKNPEVALEQFYQLKSILDNETDTFRSGLYSPREFKKQVQSDEKDLSNIFGDIPININGKQVFVPAEQAYELQLQGGVPVDQYTKKGISQKHQKSKSKPKSDPLGIR